jgi:formylglycine-generating enzyme required for sulfatase activity
MLNYLSDNPGASLWLSETVYGGGRNIVSASAWYQGHKTAKRPPGEERPGSVLNLRGIEFVSMPAGSLNRDFPYTAESPTPSFWIAASEVSGEDWGRFIRENPRWAPDNRSVLVGEGLVSEDYLILPPTARSKNRSAEPGPGVTGVSWYAAKAYCAWLNASLAMPGYTVRLPTELEWEYAARVNQRAVPQPLRFMLLSHWEWCENPYSYLDYLPQGALDLIDVPERPVRGGSWLNPPDTIAPDTRGALSPETCSPFVSFRPVIARNNNETNASGGAAGFK